MKNFYALICCCFTTIIYAQATIVSSVISSSGDTNSNASNSIDFTIGETFTSVITNASSIDQGFWFGVSSLNTLSTQDVELDDTIISVYPNPTTDFLQLKTTSLDDYTVSLFNSNGQQLISQKITPSPLGNQIDVSTFSEGIYILSVINSLGHKRIKIIKQ